MPTPVLVVDDHRTFADLMVLGLDAQPDLRCAGVAYGVEQARRLAAAVPYRAAVVDLALPDGDGAELVRELHGHAPDARIVVLTAHPRSDLARRAFEAVGGVGDLVASGGEQLANEESVGSVVFDVQDARHGLGLGPKDEQKRGG